MTIGYSPPALPPSDVDHRELPVRVMDLANAGLMRIHKATRSPIFYNSSLVSSTVFRFDAPAGQYGVLYAAEVFETCMAETVIRARFQSQRLPLVLTETELSQRSVTALLPAFTQPAGW